MIIVNKIGNSITGSVNGKRYGVAFSQEKYDAMLAIVAKSEEAQTIEELNALIAEFEPLTVQSYAETVETACPHIHVNQATGQFFLKEDGKVSKVPMPKSFVDRILTSLEKNIDVLPLVKFWSRLLRNPKLTALKTELLCNYIANTYVDVEEVNRLTNEEGVTREVAVERATSLQTPITKEGLLVTYKVSREILHKWELDEEGNKKRVDRYAPTKTIDDVTGEVKVEQNLPEFVEDRIFEPAVVGQSHDAFACDGVLGHIIKVGSRIVLPEWNQVDCNDYRSCVKGLHVGNLDYIRGYQQSDTETHNVFVDPMMVGAITDDGSGALRVKEYFVYSSFAGVNKSLYHSSAYAAMTDAEWAKMRAEAIENGNKLIAEIQAAQEEVPA